MSRSFGYLVAEQCRTVAGVGAVAWAILVGAALVAEWFSGVPLALTVRSPHLGALATVVLPFVIAVTGPLATGLVVQRLHEHGELQALWSIGRGPQLVALALILPLLPCGVVLHGVVDVGRPAAFAVLATGETGFDVVVPSLRSDTLGIVPGSTGWRVLVDLGERALAVELSGDPSSMTTGTRLGDGTFTVFDSTAGSIAWRGVFADAELDVRGFGRSLGGAHARELSSSFLATNQSVWSRLHASSSGVRVARSIVHRELATRGWMLPCWILAIAIVLWPLWWRRIRSAPVMMGGVVLPTLLVALVLPGCMP